MSNSSNPDNLAALFTQLLLSFHAGAWQQLGKTANPFTNKVERNLEMAKNSIDIIGMLEEKTKGNLTEEESILLKHILTELRMNYVEELKKPEPEEKDKSKSEQPEKQAEAENDKADDNKS